MLENVPTILTAQEMLDKAFHNDGYLTHPTFFAGWVGLLVTGINLLPASQLDGGHVARAVLGERMKWAAYAAVAGLVYLALRFQSWMLMAIFILLMGVQHPPPLNDRTGLDLKRKVLAAVVRQANGGAFQRPAVQLYPRRESFLALYREFISRRPILVRQLESGPIFRNRGAEVQQIPAQAESQNFFDPHSVHPRGRARVPSPAGATHPS